MNEQARDEDLIAACRAGDEAAWEALVKRYERLIYAIPRRAGLDEDAAGDVFQQVFAALVKYLDRIEQPAQIQAWLVTTARRETLRVLSARRSAGLISIDDEAGEEKMRFEIADSAILPDELIIKIERERRVRAAVENSDERCRRLLEMLFYEREQPSYAEIADALGISEGSIGPTRARCLQKLREKLKKI